MYNSQGLAHLSLDRCFVDRSELFIAIITVATKHHHFYQRYRIDARITDLKLKKLVEKTAKN
jgi:hypothetical protein